MAPKLRDPREEGESCRQRGGSLPCRNLDRLTLGGSDMKPVVGGSVEGGRRDRDRGFNRDPVVEPARHRWTLTPSLGRWVIRHHDRWRHWPGGVERAKQLVYSSGLSAGGQEAGKDDTPGGLLQRACTVTRPLYGVPFDAGHVVIAARPWRQSPVHGPPVVREDDRAPALSTEGRWDHEGPPSSSPSP